MMTITLTLPEWTMKQAQQAAAALQSFAWFAGVVVVVYPAPRAIAEDPISVTSP